MSRKIKLTKNKYTLIDNEDYEYLNQWKWYYNSNYARRSVYVSNKNTKCILIHRLIMNCPDDMQVDHINGNTLDNRKENLRIVNRQQNVWNRKKGKNTTSKYKGVSFCKRNQKWLAQIMINSKTKHLGYYNNEKEAAKAYNEAAIKYHLIFTRLNDI